MTPGYLRDLTGSYDPALFLVIAGALLAAGVVLRVRLPARRAPLQRHGASHT